MARRKKAGNPFVADLDYCGEMTVGMLVELVQDRSEFPKGLDTVIRIGDVEGDNGIAGDVTVLWHRKGDVVLGIDPNSGDPDYGTEEDPEWK